MPEPSLSPWAIQLLATRILCGCASFVITRAAEPKLRALDDLQRAERISIAQLP
jgi:hypothetical protein